MYGNTEKVENSFEITNKIFRLFLGMLLLIGCQKVPDRKMDWETPPDYFVQTMFDSMPRDTFERILQNLNLRDNEQLD